MNIIKSSEMRNVQCLFFCASLILTVACFTNSANAQSSISKDAVIISDAATSSTKRTVNIETAVLKGVQPGTTTTGQLQQKWGAPQSKSTFQGITLFHYNVPPFKKCVVTVSQGVVSTIVLHLEKKFPPASVAKQLNFSKIDAVMIRDEQGLEIGQVYPERGVMFDLENEGGKLLVGQIVLDGVTAEPFVLRAERDMQQKMLLAMQDLNNALKLNPKNHRALWLKAKLLTQLGQTEKAITLSEKSVTLSPKDASYQLLYARLLMQTGKVSEANSITKKIAQNNNTPKHVLAEAFLLLGNITNISGSTQTKTAMGYHLQAIEVAKILTNQQNAELRRAAKQTLVDAHVAVANDVALGNWKQKLHAVQKWLYRATEIANELVKSDGGTTDTHFRLSCQSLGVYANLHGKMKIEKLTELNLKVGRDLIDKTADPLRKRQIHLNLAQAMYYAVTTLHTQGQDRSALKYGTLAMSNFESATGNLKLTEAQQFFKGQLSFRIGAVHAVSRGDHNKALPWYERAIPLLRKNNSPNPHFNITTQGEAFTSMGVTYWQAGQRDRAVKLTSEGVGLIQQAIKQGITPQTTLAIPYGNLSSMYEALGDKNKAKSYAEISGRLKRSIRR